VIFQGKRAQKALSISAFSRVPGKGIGKAVIEQSKKWERDLRPLPERDAGFFPKIRFCLKKKIKNYYASSVDGTISPLSKSKILKRYAILA